MKTIKQFLLHTFLMATAVQANAQTPNLKDRANAEAISKSSLSGKVTDQQSAKPLAGATIYLPDLKLGTTTLADGTYTLQNLPSGHYVATISYAGYAAVATTIEVLGDSKKDFTLSTSVAENENVTVTGVSKPTQVKRTPTPVTIVNKTYLNRSSATNLIDAISHTAGVSQLTTGPAISKPFIRGLGYNRLITINDGIRQEGQQWGDEHGIEIDEYSAQKIEILRGPSSLIYGSDALAGVINIITNLPVPQATVQATVSGSFNGNNNQVGGYANIAGNTNGFSWNAYSSYKKAGDYQNAYDGRVLNSRFAENNFGGLVGINKSWGYSHFIFSYYNQKPGLVEGDRDAIGKFILYAGTPLEQTATNAILNSKILLIPNQNIRHTKIALDNSFAIGGGRLAAVVGYQQNERQEYGDVDAPTEAGLWFKLTTINYNIAYHVKENNGWSSSFGLSGMQQTNKNLGVEFLIPAYNLLDVGGFFYTQKNINNQLTLSGGLRLDNRNLNSKKLIDAGNEKFVAFKRTFTNLSASVGLSYELPNNLVLKLNLARGFRAPSIPELAANGEHEGTNRYEIGANDLKSETSLQADGGVALNTSHISFAVNGYYNHINNFIFYQKLLAKDGSDSLTDNTTTFKFNQRTGNIYGAEVRLDLHPHPLDWLHFENTLSITNGRFEQKLDGSKNLPLIAPAHLFTELRAEFARATNSLHNLYVKVEMDNTAKQSNPFTGFDTETATAGYTLFNIGFGTDVVCKNTKLASLVLSLNNVGNVAYQNHLSRLKYTAENVVTGRIGVFNMGRNFTARLIIPFSWKLKS